jgi:hypothetical protein
LTLRIFFTRTGLGFAGKCSWKVVRAVEIRSDPLNRKDAASRAFRF